MGRRTGRAELDEHAEGVHYSEIDVDLAPSKRRKEDIYASIRETLSGLPASVAIGQPIGHRLDHLQSGIRAQIVLKIFGQDIEMLRRLADTSRQRLSTIPGLVDLQVEKQVLIPQVRVQVDHARAALHGLTPAAITQTLDALSNGRKVSQIVDGNRRFDVVIRLSEQDRSTTGLHNLADSDRPGIRPAERAGRGHRDGWTEPDSARGNAAPDRGLRQWRRPPRHGGDRRRHPQGARGTGIPAGLHDQSGGHLPGAGGSHLAYRNPLARVAGDDLHRALQPLSIDGPVAHHHGRNSARPDRQRRRLENRRSAVVGGIDDRLHHARRHLGAQRDSEDLPLHQSRHPRRRAVRNRS